MHHERQGSCGRLIRAAGRTWGIALITALCMASAALGATGDATAPTLTGVSISPATIETSTGAKTVTVRVSGTDAGSGIQHAQVF